MFQQNRSSTTLSFNDVPQYAGCLAGRPYPEYVRHRVFEFYGAPKWPITRIATTFCQVFFFLRIVFVQIKKNFTRLLAQGHKK